MPQVLKDNRLIDDSWTLLTEDSESLPSGDILLSYSQWQTFSDQLDSHDGSFGVIIVFIHRLATEISYIV